jgi:hypothetical protein
MQTTSHHPKLHYHTWKDIGGPIGLLLDGAFFVFVLISAGLMLAFCSVLLGLNYLVSPILALGSRIHPHHAA